MPPPAASSPKHEPTSLVAKLLNMFVSPGDVFDEILAQSIRPAAWIVPTLLVVFASLFLLAASTTPEQTSAAIRHLVEAGRISPGDTAAVTNRWLSISAITICVSALVGTLWSAFMLWGIGRFFLKAAFRFSKALEVVGLTGMILVLGTIVTTLLILASGNPAARPALSLLVLGLNQESTLRAALDIFNVFYLWSTAVLAIGLSRLAGVSLKESAFWAFGYWLVLRIGLILLG